MIINIPTISFPRKEVITITDFIKSLNNELIGRPYTFQLQIYLEYRITEYVDSLIRLGYVSFHSREETYKSFMELIKLEI